MYAYVTQIKAFNGCFVHSVECTMNAHKKCPLLIVSFENDSFHSFINIKPACLLLCVFNMWFVDGCNGDAKTFPHSSIPLNVCYGSQLLDMGQFACFQLPFHFFKKKKMNFYFNFFFDVLISKIKISHKHVLAQTYTLPL